jgi:hypothetical protein
MSIISLPALVVQTLESQSWGQQRYDTTETSDESGEIAVNAGAPPRWTCTLRSPSWLTLEEAAEWEAMLLRLRGGINHLAVYDVLRPAPRGTMRGSPVLGAPVQRGDTSCVITNVVGTIARGDWIGLGVGLGTSQTVKAVDPVASSVLTPTSAVWVNNVSAAATWVNNASQPATWWLGGTVTLQFEAPAREDMVTGTPVVWDRPLTYFTTTNNQTTWQTGRNGPTLAGYAFDGVEQWS